MRAKQRRWASVIVGVSFVGTAAILMMPAATAQTSVPPRPPRLTIPVLPPTFPCPLCGPSGQRGNGTTAWVYPLHFCPNADGSAEFAVIYGLGSLYDDSATATFFGSIQGTVRQLRTLRPGDETAEYPTVNVQPGQSFLLDVWATTDGTQGGPRVTFGNGTTLREMVLVCECPTPQTLVTTVPTTTGTTIPGDTTTVPAVASSTPRSPTTTSVGRLPDTGTETPYYIAAVGLVIAYIGLLGWAYTRRLDD